MTATPTAEGATPDRTYEVENAQVVADRDLAMQILEMQRLHLAARRTADEDRVRVTAAEERLADQLAYADKLYRQLGELLSRVGAL